MKKIVTIIAIVAGLVSCVYPYNPDLEGTSEDIVVIEGSIVAGGTSTVQFSTVASLSSVYYGAQRIPGVAWVEDDEGKIYSSPTLSPATSISIPMDNAPLNRRYRMKAEINDQVYCSDWLEPLLPPEIEDVSFSLTPDSNQVQVSVSLNGGEQGTGYVGLSFDETWEFHADYYCRYQLDTLTWEVSPRPWPYPNYWCWKHAASQSVFLMNYSEMTENRIISRPIQVFSRTSNRLQKLYSINVTAFTLTDKAYKYMSNLAYISNMNGSLFAPNPGEMPSNIICETLPDKRVEGYVSASLATSCRVFLDSDLYIYKSPPTNYLFLPEKSYHSLYYDGYYPVDMMTLPVMMDEEEQEVTDIFWGPLSCIDCVVSGGTKQKPDYWP